MLWICFLFSLSNLKQIKKKRRERSGITFKKILSVIETSKYDFAGIADEMQTNIYYYLFNIHHFSILLLCLRIICWECEALLHSSFNIVMSLSFGICFASQRCLHPNVVYFVQTDTFFIEYTHTHTHKLTSHP